MKKDSRPFVAVLMLVLVVASLLAIWGWISISQTRAHYEREASRFRYEILFYPAGAKPPIAWTARKIIHNHDHEVKFEEDHTHRVITIKDGTFVIIESERKIEEIQEVEKR